MTRKHFQEIANALRVSRPMAEDGEAAMAAWRDCVENVANACSKANGRFDRGRFDRACNATTYDPAQHGR